MNLPHYAQQSRDEHNRFTGALFLATPSERTELANTPLNNFDALQRVEDIDRYEADLAEAADIVGNVKKMDRGMLIGTLIMVGMVAFYVVGRMFGKW